MYGLYIDPYHAVLTCISWFLHSAPFLFFCLCCLYGFLAIGTARLFVKKRTVLEGVTVSGVSLLVLYYLAGAALYVVTPGYLDHMEPGITVISRILGSGKPLYHAVDSPERYAQLYGPVLYGVNYFFQCLFNIDIIFSSKCAGAVLGIGSIALLYFVFRNRLSGFSTSIMLGFVVSCFLWFGHYSFWNKGESLLLFCCSAGCCAVFIRSASVQAVIMSIIVAAVINTKVHAVIYCLPFLISLLFIRGLKVIVYSAVLSAFLVSLPFFAFGSVSLQNYICLLGAVGEHPLSLSLFFLNMKYAGLLFLPVIAVVLVREKASPISQDVLRKQIVLAASILAGLAAAAVFGSKIGAGPHHLLPFAPGIALLMVRPFSETARTRINSSGFVPYAGLVISLWLVISFLTVYKNYRLVSPFYFQNPHEAVWCDLIRLRHRFMDYSMQMGYGDGSAYRFTWVRPVIYTSGKDYFLDAPALMDMKEGGMKITAKTLAAFENQRFDMWIIPGQGKPFTMPSLYPPFKRLFGSEIPEVFVNNYEHIGQTDFFGIWKAKRLVNGSS